MMEYNKAKLIADTLRAELLPFCNVLEIAGALRRRDSEVADIEFVAIPRFEVRETGQRQLDGMDVVVRYNILFEWLNENQPVVMGGTRYVGWCVLDLGEIRASIFTAEIATWGYLFLARTGPLEFMHNVIGRLRNTGIMPRAAGAGLQNSAGVQIAVPSESAVFEMCGAEYVVPWERGGAGL